MKGRRTEWTWSHVSTRPDEDPRLLSVGGFLTLTHLCRISTVRRQSLMSNWFWGQSKVHSSSPVEHSTRFIVTVYLLPVDEEHQLVSAAAGLGVGHGLCSDCRGSAGWTSGEVWPSGRGVAFRDRRPPETLRDPSESADPGPRDRLIIHSCTVTVRRRSRAQRTDGKHTTQLHTTHTTHQLTSQT